MIVDLLSHMVSTYVLQLQFECLAIQTLNSLPASLILGFVEAVAWVHHKTVSSSKHYCMPSIHLAVFEVLVVCSNNLYDVL